MEVDIGGTKAGILRSDKSIVPRIFIQAAGDIVELFEEIWIFDVDFIRSYPYNRAWCGRW